MLKHKKSGNFLLKPSTLALAAAGVLWGQAAWAAPLYLAQSPAGVLGRAPAPNVILSLDDSGSMEAGDGGPGGMTRVQALREAIAVTFSSNNPDVADGKIRLAWQGMTSCYGFPSNTYGCNDDNLMRSLEGADNDTRTHRGRFLRWARNLRADFWTPIHGVMQSAGQYLSKAKTDKENPWRTKPGDSSSDYLPCRRSYHILMTDGGWNMSYNYNVDAIPANRRRAVNVQAKFPDGTIYAPGGEQTRIYAGPNEGVEICSGYYNWRYINCVYNGSTISDMAFYYWSVDLQPDIDDKVAPLMRIQTPELIAHGSRSVNLQPYWNPKNDPSTWQNMITYTIGFGDAASFPHPRWDRGTDDMYSMNTTSDYAALINGQAAWPKVGSNLVNSQINQSELWHAAIVSRGRFIPARDVNDLKKAFASILAQISIENKKPLTGFTAASASYSRNGTDFYHSVYDTGKNWLGYVGTQKIDVDGKVTGSTAWGLNSSGNGNTTADILDAYSPAQLNNRVILTSAKQSGNQYAGAPFVWGSLDNDQKTLLRTTYLPANTIVGDDALGKARLEFLRGDRSNEGASGRRFRERTSRQGDIVNSALWYVGAPAADHSVGNYSEFITTYYNRLPIIYVGGNDGMLHGFSAETGEEKIAYVPKGVYKNLSRLTNADYNTDHRYFVDGSPVVGDYQNGGDWSTVLIGTLGAGGKGYFALNVTNPGSKQSATPPVNSSEPEFKAANAQQLVLFDYTGDDDADMGHIMGEPLVAEGNPQHPMQIVRVNDSSADGRWAYITGNGVNSTNGKAVLYVQYLDGAREQKKVQTTSTGTCETGSNGLFTPRPLDVNDDGKVDYVYAGDMCGNMWKFDLSDSSASAWQVAEFAEGRVPLYTAQDATGVRQPITSAPLLKPNTSKGGLMVAFGTGRNMTEPDRVSVTPQTFYSVLDMTRYIESGNEVRRDTSVNNPVVPAGRTKLVSRVYTSASKAGSGNSSALTFWGQQAPSGSINRKVDYAAGDRGWYFDLPVASERVLSSPEFYEGSNIIEVMSTIPASGSESEANEESCAASPKAAKWFRTLINIETGDAPTVALMDVNGDGFFNMAGDSIAQNISASRSGGEGSDRQQKIAGELSNKRIMSGGGAEVLGKLPSVLLRPNWRQLN